MFALRMAANLMEGPAIVARGRMSASGDHTTRVPRVNGKPWDQLPMQRVGRRGGEAPNHRGTDMGTYVIEIQGWPGT